MLLFGEKELQYRIIYAIIVAGKNAKFAEAATKRLFPALSDQQYPFDIVRNWVVSDQLENNLRDARTGNYSKIKKALECLVDLDIDLATCTPIELEQVPGIGPKTSRFFVLWTRPDARCAALDVHVLRWLRGLGYDVPKVTPSGKKYAKIEQLFLREADRMNLTPRELDERIWKAGAQWDTYNPDNFISE